MAAMKASEVFISFIRECSVKIEDYSNLVLDQDNWLEELYLDSRNKLTASVEGNVILPKTPAAKRGGRGGRKHKLAIPEELLEEADGEKENVVDDLSHSQEQGKKVDAGNEDEYSTPTLSRSGRAASKAANAKIKETQRLLNDLSSKRRRPDTTDEHLTAVETEQFCKRKNKRDHSDSGVYDRYSTCSNASTTSTRSARNQKGASNKHGNNAAQHFQSAAGKDMVLEESDEEEDIRTDDGQKVNTPANGRKVDFIIRQDEFVVDAIIKQNGQGIVNEDVKNSSDKVRKRSSLSHTDEPSKKVSKNDLSLNSVSNNLAHSEMVCRVDLVSLEATSVGKAEPPTEEVLNSTNSRRLSSLQGRQSRSSSSSMRGDRFISSTCCDKLITNADNLKDSCKPSERQNGQQVIDIIEPPQEFCQKSEEPNRHDQPDFKQPEIPRKHKPIEVRSPPKPQPRTTRTKTRNVENQEQQQEEVNPQQQQEIIKLKQQQLEIAKQQQQAVVKQQQQQQEVFEQHQQEVVEQHQQEAAKQHQQEVVKQQQLVPSAEDRPPPRATRTKKRPVEETTEHSRPRLDSSVSSLQSESSTRSTRTKKRKLEQQQKQVVAKPASAAAVSSKATEVCLILSDSEDEEVGSYNSTKAVGSGTSTESPQGKVVVGKSNPRMVLPDQIDKKSPLPAKNTFNGSNGVNHSKKFVSALRKVEESIRDSCPNVVSVCVSPLHEAVIKSAASPRGISKQQANLLGDCVTDDEVDPNTVSDRDGTNNSQESFDTTEDEEEEKEEEEEPEEPELLLQPPRRMTRSKVRLQQQQVPSITSDSPEQTERRLAAVAAKSKKQMVTTGKFSPRPFSNRTGVKQLAAAYDHVVSVSTPLAKGQSRGLPRVSSTSRLPPNTSSRFLNTPQTLNRVRALNPSGLSSSNDSHHYRHISKVVTPSHTNRPKNLVVNGMKSFLSSSVAVQPTRPTKEELQELKEEDIRRKREKEEETLRKREERLRTKGIETKKRNEERMRKVQEARMANERKAAELKESLEKEKREQQLREKRLREEKLREETLKKKQAMLRKAEEEKRKREEEIKRKEEEAQRRRREEAEERRQEAERKAALLKKQEEERLEEERLAEEKKRADEKQKMLEEKQRREAERHAREKEELQLLREREAARLASSANQKQQKQPTIPLNQTFDANSTYTVAGNANSTYTAAPGSAKSGITPKTPASNRPESYEMTPAQDENNYGIDDLKSEDSSDDDSNPKKTVPKWATRLELHRSLVIQEYSSLSLDEVFPCQELLLLPDLNKIFKIKRSRFKIRSSSAHWTTPPHKIFSTKIKPDT